MRFKVVLRIQVLLFYTHECVYSVKGVTSGPSYLRKWPESVITGYSLSRNEIPPLISLGMLCLFSV